MKLRNTTVESCKGRYEAPAVRVAGMRLEYSFLQSIQTGPIGDWKEEPEPEIEF